MNTCVRLFVSLFLVISNAALAANIGQPAPDFALPDVKGKVVRLSALKGNTVILEWVNPNTVQIRSVGTG